jgi:ATP-dependent protease HslVU (ClpYQ) peptidase subunit
MTTIAASRLHGEMAADTQVNFGSSTFPSKKIYSFGGRLAGAAGTSIDCSLFMQWVAGGLDPEARPEMEDGDEFQALVLSHDGLFFFEADCCPVRIERDFHAIGTGGDAALAAFFCGKTPRRAVEIAAKIDSGTGGPVTVLKLEG